MNLRKNKIFLSGIVAMAFMPSCLLNSCDMVTFDGIATTTGAMYDFTKRIVGDQMEVITILGENEAHGFEPNSPQIAAKTESARLLVAYGQNIDSYAKNMIAKDKYFEATSNVTFFNAKDSNGEDTSTIDPHAWLSIKDAERMMESIKDIIIEVDPDNETIYNTNYQVALSEFQNLDLEYESALNQSSIKTNIFVTSHEAFAYLARDYNLHQYGMADIANNEPTSVQIANVVEYIHENDIHYICLEELDNPGFVDTVISELISRYPGYEMETLELKAFEGVDVDEWDDDDNYIAVMKENLTQLAKALGNNTYGG